MKRTYITRASCAALLSAGVLFALAATSRADLDYHVTLNVASLIANPNGAFSLDLQLVAGGPVTNTVTLSNIVLVGGSFTGGVGGQTVAGGNVTGSFTSGSLKLTNTALDNEVYQAFGPGVTSISFDVDETTHTQTPLGSSTPDAFNVAILDGSLANIPTADSNSNDIANGVWALVAANSGMGSVNSIGVFNSSPAPAEAPGVTTAVIVPEPTSAALLLCGVAGLGFRRRTSRRA